MDLPVPGGPMSRTLCPPAAAISSARLTDSWPLTSLKDSGDVHLRAGDFDLAFEEFGRLAEIADGNHAQALDDGGFGGVLGGHENAGASVPTRLDGDGQHAFDGTHGAGQGQFAHHDETVQPVGLDLFARRQHAQGDGQIETRTFLLDVGGRQIDGGPPQGKLKPGIVDGGADAVPRLFDGRVRQPDDDHDCVSPSRIDFHLDRVRVDTLDRGGTYLG
jgi:hypothetical protein